MLKIMRDEQLDLPTRLDAAKAVAPYVHPRLASIDATVKSTTEVSLLSGEERRQRARQAILEAFAERPMRLIEGEVIEAAEMGEKMGSASTPDSKSLSDKDEDTAGTMITSVPPELQILGGAVV